MNSSGLSYPNDEGTIATSRYSKYVFQFRAYVTPIIFITGFIGNVLVIVIFARMHANTRFSVYAISLAIAHLICLIMNGLLDDFMGRGVDYLTGRRNNLKLDIISDGMCQFVEFILNSMYTTSSYVLVAFSFDRLITILQPIRLNSVFYRRFSVCLCLFVYFLAMIVNMPLLFVTRIELNRCIVDENDSELYNYIVLFKGIGTFILPVVLITLTNMLIIIAMCKLEQTRREYFQRDSSITGPDTELSRIIGHLALSTVFILLYIPLVYSLFLRIYAHRLRIPVDDPWNKEITDLSRLMSSLKDMTYSVSFLLYLIFLRKFRYSFRSMLCQRMHGCSSNNDQETFDSAMITSSSWNTQRKLTCTDA